MRVFHVGGRMAHGSAVWRIVSVTVVAIFTWLAPAAAQGQRGAAAAPGGLTLEGAAAPVQQGATRAEGGPARPSVVAVRTTQPPAIDGRLDDAVWRSAAKIDTFVQERPLEGAPATEKTEVHIAYDNEKIYFAIHAHYSDISLMRANRVDRDRTEEDDTVSVSFDPFVDQQLGYTFSVNGYGVQGDSVLKIASTGPGLASSTATTGATGDLSWNALYTSAGQLVEDGWTAEMAIPFKSLRYPARGNNQPHRWGFQVERQIRTKNETAVWSPMSRDVPSFMRQMGTLDGMTNLSTSRNFEILPTFTAVRSGALNTTTGEYVTDDLEEGGVNVKYGLTSTMTLDFTYNPDFSQIESDTQQIEVNQRFPINYPELRPFFLEGYDNIRIGGPATFIHTRTIVDPQFGAKLTGKMGKTTLGFLLANDEAPGKVDPANPAFEKTAQAAVARVRYDYRSENSIGVLFTDREFLNSYSRLIGMDKRFRQGRYYASFIGFVTDKRDLTGARKTGNMMEGIFRKDGRNLNYSVLHLRFDPEYATDLGFVNRVDRKSTNVRASYRFWPEGWIINWGPEINYNRLYDYAGILQDAGPGAALNFQFAKNINAGLTYDTDMERYRDVEYHKKRFGMSGAVNTNRKIAFSGNFSVGDGILFNVPSPYLGRSTTYSATATFRPISRLQSVLKLDGTKFTDPADDAQEFDVKIVRSSTTYQFTPRLLVRNITEFNTGLGSRHTLFQNILVTYRVNSGTVFYVGYDDRYRQGDAINSRLFDSQTYQRTNRSIFTKIQYLFRSGGGAE